MSEAPAAIATPSPKTGFLYSQLRWKPPAGLPSVDLTTKTVLITGGNRGIGLEFAKRLLELKVSRLILSVRNVEAANSLVEKELQPLSPTSTIVLRELDLLRFSSVATFADEILAEERLDIVVLNAGVNALSWTTTPDGNETLLQVNYLSSALLALLLLPKLQAAPGGDGRLTWVTSMAHGWTPFKERRSDHILQTLNDKKRFNAGDRYNVSKLLCALWCQEAAKRASGVVINHVHPGMVTTEFNDRLPLWVRPVVKLGNWAVGRTPEVAARVLVTAVLEVGNESHGGYIENCRLTEASAFARSEEAREVQRRVWEETEELLTKATGRKFVF